MRLLLHLATWAIATMFGLFVAAETRIGPVVVALSYRHGIHLGDLVAFMVAYAWAARVSLGLLLTDRTHSSR